MSKRQTRVLRKQVKEARQKAEQLERNAVGASQFVRDHMLAKASEHRQSARRLESALSARVAAARG